MATDVRAEVPPILSSLGPQPRIAVLRASRIGDVICCLPALNDLKRAAKGCELTVVALPFVKDLLSRVPFVDRFVPFPGFPGMAEQFFSARAALSFFSAMQARAFDLAIQMHGSGAFSNPVACMFGARLTAGFVGSGGHPGRLDLAFPLPEDMSEVARCRAIVAALGAPDASLGSSIRLTAEDALAAYRLLQGRPRPWIGLHPWTRDANKAWPLEKYLSLAAFLVEHTGGTAFLLGDLGEGLLESAAREAAAPLVPLGRRILDLCGQTSLTELAAVVATLDLLVGNDSAPAHLAYLFNTPSVTIFGGTDPYRWGAQDWPGARSQLHAAAFREAECRPCEPPACPRDVECLRGITVEAVAQQALRVLSLAGDLGDELAQKKVEPAITGGL